MPKVIGVDSSTQSCKLIIVESETGEILSTVQSAHPDETEVDPEHWWQALQQNMEKVDLDGVKAISIAAQQHGMVLLGKDAEVLRPALLWNDTRSAPEAKQLIEHFGAAELANRTGLVPVASFTVTKLLWVRNHEPEIAAKVAAVALPHDWLTWRLRGYGPEGKSKHGPDLEKLTTDRSDASGTGYFSPFTSQYDTEILSFALGHTPIVPVVLSSDQPAGETENGILVAAGGGDNAMAALGLGAEVGDVIVSLGTSGTVFALTSTGSRDETGAVAGFADASGQYLPLIATLNAARTIDSVREFLGQSWDEFSESLLASPPGAEGMVMAPFFDGERTPNLPDATATVAGITRSTLTKDNFARSVVEGVLANLADGIDAIVGKTEAVRRILAIGGAAQNQAILKVMAEIFSLPIAVPKAAEYVALGAAAQATWAVTNGRPSWENGERTITNPGDKSPARSQFQKLVSDYGKKGFPTSS